MERGRASTLSIETGELSSEGETPTNTAEGNRRSNHHFLFMFLSNFVRIFSSSTRRWYTGPVDKSDYWRQRWG